MNFKINSGSNYSVNSESTYEYMVTATCLAQNQNES